MLYSMTVIGFMSAIHQTAQLWLKIHNIHTYIKIFIEALKPEPQGQLATAVENKSCAILLLFI